MVVGNPVYSVVSCWFIKKLFKMKISEFLEAKGLDSVADIVHKHPFSGSSYSLRSLLASYIRLSKSDMFFDFINSKSDACSLEASLAEQTDKEFREYVASLKD